MNKEMATLVAGLKEKGTFDAVKGMPNARTLGDVAGKQGGIEKILAEVATKGKKPGVAGTIESALAEALGGGKVGKFVGGNWWWLLPIFLGIYAKGHVNKGAERAEVNAQTDNLKQIGAGMSSDSPFYQAMMPAAQQENQMAQMALMSRLSGGGAPQMQLARGEELIGNR
jgi:hypothetical protein